MGIFFSYFSGEYGWKTKSAGHKKAALFHVVIVSLNVNLVNLGYSEHKMKIEEVYFNIMD